jgi:hypothetical protein
MTNPLEVMVWRASPPATPMGAVLAESNVAFDLLPGVQAKITLTTDQILFTLRQESFAFPMQGVLSAAADVIAARIAQQTKPPKMEPVPAASLVGDQQQDQTE